MNLTKKLLHTALLTSIIFNLTGCFYKTLEPNELTKAKEISINGTNYLPEFNGLDAFYLGQEELVLGKEENWYIHNKKLYLFVDEDTKQQWFVQMPMMIEAGTKQWEKFNTPTDEKFEDINDTFMNGNSH